MTDYTLEQAKSSNSSTRGHYGHSTKPTGITIHHWGSTGQTHDGVVSWLRGAAGGTSNTQTSAHYVCSDGRVTQLVDDSRAAWHAGSTTGNGATIGIECRPEMSTGDWDTLVQLCADLEEKHGSLKYYGHKDWKNTACPGKYYDRIGELVDAVNATKAGKKPQPSKPSEPKPSTPSGDVPGPGYSFPWPSGHYIGPKSGPDRSHSGFYDHRSANGKTDRAWIKEFGKQLSRRGWSVGKGKTYLTKSGNDGLYGGEYKALIRAFQNEQNLSVDGLAGDDTWCEAFTGPVT